MKNTSYLVFLLIAIVSSVAILFPACRKINESTDLGGGLIPPIDNINTFDTVINALVYNDTIGLADDSLRVSKTDEYFLGKITNDPFFGATDARIFLELKPASYPFVFNTGHTDSLHIDSVVLILSHEENYGDSDLAQTINVYELDNNPGNVFQPDSFYLIRQNNLTYTNLLGSRTFAPKVLDDSVKAYLDTTKGQMRIRLDDNFGQRLLNYDSSSNAIKGAYKNDSTFRSKFKGFALQSVAGGNALMGFNLADPANTKLAIYYRFEKNMVTHDTVSYFNFSSSSVFNVSQYSASANYIIRDYSGTPFLASLSNGTGSDASVYIQNSPGTLASIKIPDLAAVSNRVLHRAELVVEEDYDASDEKFTAPQLLYLDAYDDSISGTNKYRTIPYNASIDVSGNLNYQAFGCFPVLAQDGMGHTVKTWKFNITRYLQHYLTRTLPLYDFRLFAPVYVKENYAIPPATDLLVPLNFNPTTTKGRVRLVGTTGPGDTNPRRLRLRLIYSKL